MADLVNFTFDFPGEEYKGHGVALNIGTTATEILPYNLNRHRVLLVNNGLKAVYIMFGATTVDVTTTPIIGMRIDPGKFTYLKYGVAPSRVTAQVKSGIIDSTDIFILTDVL